MTMRRISVEALEADIDPFIAWLDAGEEVIITRDGRDVVIARPVTDARPTDAQPTDAA